LMVNIGILTWRFASRIWLVIFFFLLSRKLVKGWEETMKNTHVHFFGGHGDNFLVMTVRTVPMNQCLNCRFWLHEIPP
jgi:hypothetical protein